MDNFNDDKKIIPSQDAKVVSASVINDKSAEIVKPENTIHSKGKDSPEPRVLEYEDVHMLERAIRLPEIIEKFDENTTILKTDIKGQVYEKPIADWREYFRLGVFPTKNK